jgi:hypothetical protein
MFTEVQKQEIKEIFKSGNFTFLENSVDINNLLDIKFKDLDDFNETLNHYINEHEIIYYSVAIDFLRDNDTSLRESMEIAEDFGYSPKNLSSEILATLLFQKYAHDEAGLLIEEIENLLID